MEDKLQTLNIKEIDSVNESEYRTRLMCNSPFTHSTIKHNRGLITM